METWFLGSASSGEIEEVKVLKETDQKVQITGRFGSSSIWYEFKTGISRGHAYRWIRRDRDEVKRLMIEELERQEREAMGTLSYFRSLLGKAHAA